MRYIFVPILFLMVSLVSANIDSTPENDGWVSKEGARLANTESMKSINGFGGMLVVTPDKDWEQKWSTPPEITPHITEASTVRYGEELSILTFFVNPKTDNDGNIDISCNIKVTRPDGTFSINADKIDCASGKLRGSPRNVRLTSAIVKYIGEEGDPTGVWVVEVVLIDEVRKIRMPLKTQFTLE